ncbi:MAG: hypothetical protein R3C44_02855 [Chloroflexota bacterium]
MPTLYEKPQHVLYEHLLPFLFFVLITVILTYPMSLHPASIIIGRPFDDAFEYIWYLSWFKEALLDLNISPLFQPDIFYPTGWDLRFSAFPPVYPTLVTPITSLLGPIVTYNIFIMFTIVFAAFGTYLLVRTVGGNAWAATFAGVAFAFYPQRVVYFGGHLNFLIGSMWLPWIIYAIVQANNSTNHRIAWMAFAGFCLAMSVAGSWHFIFLSGVAVLIFLPACIFCQPNKWDKEAIRSWGKGILAFGITASILIGPLLANAYAARKLLGSQLHLTFTGINSTSVI